MRTFVDPQAKSADGPPDFLIVLAQRSPGDGRLQRHAFCAYAILAG